MGYVIGFSAWSGTGKTTLLEKVIRGMKAKGLRIAAVKHDVHGIDPIEDGRDSGRLRAAGAERVALIGPEDGGELEKRLAAALDALSDADLVLVEGFKHAPIPRVGLCRLSAGKALPEPPENYVAVVSDTALETAVPQFRWDEVEALTQFITELAKDAAQFDAADGKSRARATEERMDEA